ncbi:TonB-dependent siderophore receptor [Neorhizobium galegae]|uniref:TonB-dependent outermembrane ferrichrome receptor FhuA n=1 Tax=Neorhizobium galegae bv. officinalis TaxID=323656 RepID=A0A0T7GF05_NEOGA|nr:TonB-dependent siderophore receptor [Neorhizobium galegae]CDZ45869.1 TonB-dependent outermembrane ferrichrome receptor FhuA [Neorhizobium galegae bv. officinalis]
MNKRKTALGARLGLGAGVAFIALCSAWAAHAQDADTTLAPIVIRGEGDGDGTGPVKGYVARQTTTGSKTDTPLKEIPQSVSVIGREEMNDRGAISKIDQVLLYTPGVFGQPYGSDPDTDWIYVRGFNASQTGVFFDSLALTSHAYGGFQIDPFMLERVEVLKGPASVLLGGANAGGVVNLIRKRPTDEPYYYTETGINTNGNAFFGFDISDKVTPDGSFSYRLTGKIAGGDNYTDYSEDLRGFIMPQFTFSPDAGTSLTVWAYLSGLDQVHTTNGLLPYGGTVVNAGYGKIPRDLFLGEPDFDNGRVVQKMIGYEFEHEFEDGWKFTQNLRYANLDKREKYIYPFDFNQADAFVGRYGEDITSKGNAFNVDNRLENDFDLGGANHKVVVGLDYRYYRLHTDQFGTSFPFDSTFDPNNPIYGATPVTLSRNLNQVYTINQVGVYAQDQIKFGDGWIATFNGRYDYVHNEIDDLTPGGTANYSSNDRAWSGRAGLAYEFDNGLTPYVSAATFFSPIVGLTGRAAPKPEEGHQFEAGVKYEPSWLDGSLTASVFDITKKNYTITAGGVTSQLGEVRSKGVEVEGKFNLNENWKVIAAASYTDIEITKDDPTLVGNTPNVVPDVLGSLWLDYTVTEGPLEGLSFGAGARYRGKSWANNANTLRVPEATVFDAAIRYEKNDWKASLNVTNLLDKNYVAGCNTEFFCGYGEARTVNFKISKVW